MSTLVREKDNKYVKIEVDTESYVQQVADQLVNFDAKISLNLLIEVRAYFGSFISDFDRDLYSSDLYSFVNFDTREIYFEDVEIKNDLLRVKNKLRAFEALCYIPDLMNSKVSKPSTNIDINQTSSQTNDNKVKVVSYNSLVNQIENMSALGYAEIEEIKKQLKLIDEIVNSKMKKHVKGNDLLKIGTFLLGKGIDVAILGLPYIIDALQKI